jgi:hypothetical protein
MTARQMRILAGSASAMTAAILSLAGCAAASHTTANDVPWPASQTATAGGHTSPQTSARAATAVRQASALLKCADPVAPGRAGRAGSARAATGTARDGSASPIPQATVGRITVRQVGVAIRSQPGLVVLCASAVVHCPPGYRVLYRKIFSGFRPRVRLPYVTVCIPRYPMGTPSAGPRVNPPPVRTPPLHTMPPSQA